MPNIELDHVTKLYRSPRLFRRSMETGVEQISLSIQQGEFVFVTGKSGAGKSTLLNLISGQTRPSRGKVYVDQKDLAWLLKLSRNRAATIFGKVCQEPTLIRKRTIEENLALAAKIVLTKEPSQMTEARIKKVLALVGMRGVEKKYPVELSIGECRRVELARAMIGSPPVLILDEITANLDEDSIWDILHLLGDINRRGTTVIMATHASQYVNIMRRRVITLSEGRLLGDVKKGKYGDVLGRKEDTFLIYRTDSI